MVFKLGPQVDQSIFNVVIEFKVHCDILSSLIFSLNLGQCCTDFQACGQFLNFDFLFSRIAMPFLISFLPYRELIKRVFAFRRFSRSKVQFAELASQGSTLNASGKSLCEIRLINKVFSVLAQSRPIPSPFFFPSFFLPSPKPDTQAVKDSLTWSNRYFDGIQLVAWESEKRN